MNDVISIRRWQTVKLGIEAKRRVAKAKAERLCVACMEPLDGRAVRGCHVRCHRATLRAIERGLTTESERVAAGKFLPPAQAGRKPCSAVTLDVLGELE